MTYLEYRHIARRAIPALSVIGLVVFMIGGRHPVITTVSQVILFAAAGMLGFAAWLKPPSQRHHELKMAALYASILLACGFLGSYILFSGLLSVICLALGVIPAAAALVLVAYIDLYTMRPVRRSPRSKEAIGHLPGHDLHDHLNQD